MFEPLRFLHVAEAALDVPLGDLSSLPEELQDLAEEATLWAFDQMIEGAIAKKVDFVLLAGNTFREADQSLRARLRLLLGLEVLEDHGISVFVLPGLDDPESAWNAIPDLPRNVTVLSQGDASEVPIAFLREGKVIATIAMGQLSSNHRTKAPELSEQAVRAASKEDQIRSAPFRIGLFAGWPETNFPANANAAELSRELSRFGCDYLAVPRCDLKAKARGWRFEPGQTLHTHEGIAHHPGSLQALSDRQTGPHGATLIEVDKAGEIRGTFLPFAAVRRMRFEVPVADNAAVEDIAQAMLLLLGTEKPLANEHGWFITWVMKGTDESFGSWKTHSTQADLLDLLPSEVAGERTVSLHHQLRIQKTQGPLAEGEPSSELERLYAQTLGAFRTNDPRLFETLAENVLSGMNDLGSAEWEDRLAPLVFELDPEDILAKAQALGSEWFAEGQGD